MAELRRARDRALDMIGYLVATLPTIIQRLLIMIMDNSAVHSATEHVFIPTVHYDSFLLTELGRCATKMSCERSAVYRTDPVIVRVPLNGHT